METAGTWVELGFREFRVIKVEGSRKLARVSPSTHEVCSEASRVLGSGCSPTLSDCRGTNSLANLLYAYR